MSPEQLRGEEVDTRSDIFSFGVVLYEMLTGVHPFKKALPMETGNAILNEAPARLSQHMNEVAPVLQHTVRKMLAKEPRRRYQHIDDVRIDLEELEEESDSGELVSELSAGAKPARREVPVVGIALGLVAVGIAVAITLWLTPTVAPSQPFLTRVTSDTGLTFQPALSPDGKLVAYASDRSGAKA
ncbi:protein kinase [Acidobacteria bacterium AH-259-O06]|nr:protein kinase [Acidobacteria bacterium AH-259-O06]